MDGDESDHRPPLVLAVGVERPDLHDPRVVVEDPGALQGVEGLRDRGVDVPDRAVGHVALAAGDLVAAARPHAKDLEAPGALHRLRIAILRVSLRYASRNRGTTPHRETNAHALSKALRCRRRVPVAALPGDVRLVLAEHVGHDDFDRPVRRDEDVGGEDRAGASLVIADHYAHPLQRA